MRLPLPAAILCALVTGVIAAFAVPNEINIAGPFAAANGAPPEQFFANGSAWVAQAKLKGDWKQTANNASALAAPGPVFGVNASSLSLTRNAEGATVSVTVRYDESSAKLDAQALHQLLLRNIAAFLGTESAASGTDLVFSGSDLVVTLPAKKSSDFEVVLRRAKSAPSAVPSPAS